MNLQEYLYKHKATIAGIVNVTVKKWWRLRLDKEDILSEANLAVVEWFYHNGGNIPHNEDEIAAKVSNAIRYRLEVYISRYNGIHTPCNVMRREISKQKILPLDDMEELRDGISGVGGRDNGEDKRIERMDMWDTLELCRDIEKKIFHAMYSSGLPLSHIAKSMGIPGTTAQRYLSNVRSKMAVNGVTFSFLEMEGRA